jgi:hypothetical protein
MEAMLFIAAVAARFDRPRMEAIIANVLRDLGQPSQKIRAIGPQLASVAQVLHLGGKNDDSLRLFREGIDWLRDDHPTLQIWTDDLRPYLRACAQLSPEELRVVVPDLFSACLNIRSTSGESLIFSVLSEFLTLFVRTVGPNRKQLVNALWQSVERAFATADSSFFA